MEVRFETTEEEDEKAKDAIDEVLVEAYTSGKYPVARMPRADELWEKLLQILGIGEWSDDG